MQRPDPEPRIREFGALIADGWTLLVDHLSLILSLYAVFLPFTLGTRLGRVDTADPVYSLAVFGFQAIVAPLVTAALLTTLPALQRGQEVTLGDAFRTGLRHWGRLMLAFLAMTALLLIPAIAFLLVATLAGVPIGDAPVPDAPPSPAMLWLLPALLLCLGAAVIIGVNYSLIGCTVVLERHPHPLRRSRHLVAGHRLRILAVMLIFLGYGMCEPIAATVLGATEFRSALLPFAFFDLLAMAFSNILLYLIYTDLAAADASGDDASGDDSSGDDASGDNASPA